MALSLAVVLLAFQAFTGSALARGSETLGQFAARIHVFLYMDCAAAALVACWFVLLFDPGLGQSGWGRGLTAVEGVVVLIVAPLLLRGASHEIDPAAIERRRASVLVEAARNMVRAQVMKRIGHRELARFCTSAGVEYNPVWPFAKSTDDQELQAVRTGRVVDINLAALRELASAGRKPRLQTRLAQAVRLGDALVLMARGPTVRDPISVSPEFSSEARLQELVAALADDAIGAVNDGRTAYFRQLLLAFELLLVAAPQEWNRYGYRYDFATASGDELWPEGPVISTTQELVRIYSRAVFMDQRALAAELVDSVATVAEHAQEIRAPGLSEQMMDLLVSLYVGST